MEAAAKHCPFCRNPNRCGVGMVGGCWCGNTEIPMELIDLLPEQGKACICLECVNAFNADPAAFRRFNQTRPI